MRVRAPFYGGFRNSVFLFFPLEGARILISSFFALAGVLNTPDFVQVDPDPVAFPVLLSGPVHSNDIGHVTLSCLSESLFAM